MTGRVPLFRPGKTLVTPRLRLTIAHASDVGGLEWLSGALGPDWTPSDLAPHVEAGEAVLISRAEGQAIGLAVAIEDLPKPGWACVPFIGIAPAERFRGLGGEAGLALERRISECWGSPVVLAPVPEGRGLAVYFWLRLGYRPLTRSGAPWAMVGLNDKAGRGIWMRRDLTP